jgi:hypothetical protein
LDIFSANLSLDGRAKEVNNITMGHMEFSSFSAFDEWRSVLRDVKKKKKVHINIYPPKRWQREKMFQVRWGYLCESDMWIYVISWIVGCFSFCFDLFRLLLTYIVIHLIVKFWFDLIDLIGKYALIFLLLFAIFFSILIILFS